MTRLAWGNIERAVVDYLTAAGIPTYTEPSGKLPSAYATVERVGGTGQWIDKTVDIEIAAIADLRGDMWSLASDIESLMYELNASVAGGIYVDEVADIFGFASDPPPDQNRRRATATFSLTVRPIRV